MVPIERKVRNFVIGTAVLTADFGRTQDKIKVQRRNGAIMSRFETRGDDDSGRWRLTLYHAHRTCRFIFDAAGRVIKRTGFSTSARCDHTVGH